VGGRRGEALACGREGGTEARLEHRDRKVWGWEGQARQRQLEAARGGEGQARGELGLES